MQYIARTAAVPAAALDTPQEYILSDGMPDHLGDVIDPAGWKIDGSFFPSALFNHHRDAIVGIWKRVRIEAGKLIGELHLVEEGTSQIGDMVRSLIRQGMLDGVSVGFKALGAEPHRPTGGTFFKGAHLLEASLVSVPANPRARKKFLDDGAAIVLKGFPTSDVERSPLFANAGVMQAAKSLGFGAPGNAAATHPRSARGPMKISESITAKQAELSAIADQLSEIAKAVEAAGGDVSEEVGQKVKALEGEQTAKQGELGRLKSLEAALAARLPANEQHQHSQNGAGNGNGLQAPNVITGQRGSIKAKGWSLLLKTACITGIAYHERKNVMEVMRDRYGEDRELELFVKAASAPAQTTVVGWAAELVQETVAAFMEELKPLSIYPSLAAAGVDLTFDGTNPIRVPYRAYGTGNTTGGLTGDRNNRRLSGAFVGEGMPIPVRMALFKSLMLNAYKMAVISTFTKEMAQSSTPSIESLIRSAILEDTAWTLDLALLSDEAAIPGVRPAGLYDTLTPLTPAAAGADAAITDIRALVGAITGAGGGRNLVWIMNPDQALALELTTQSGQFIFAELMNRSQVLRNRIVSLNQPAGEVTLIDAADFATANSAPAFDVSDQATLHMDDGSYPAPATAPTVKPIVGAAVAPPAVADIATPVRSLWQTASVGVRMIMPISWGMRRPGMIAFMQNVNW